MQAAETLLEVGLTHAATVRRVMVRIYDGDRTLAFASARGLQESDGTLVIEREDGSEQLGRFRQNEYSSWWKEE